MDGGKVEEVVEIEYRRVMEQSHMDEVEVMGGLVQGAALQHSVLASNKYGLVVGMLMMLMILSGGRWSPAGPQYFLHSCLWRWMERDETLTLVPVLNFVCPCRSSRGRDNKRKKQKGRRKKNEGKKEKK
eukprot:1145263-Pelagomonas_calceolata.AAC.5